MGHFFLTGAEGSAAGTGSGAGFGVGAGAGAGAATGVAFDVTGAGVDAAGADVREFVVSTIVLRRMSRISLAENDGAEENDVRSCL